MEIKFTKELSPELLESLQDLSVKHSVRIFVALEGRNFLFEPEYDLSKEDLPDASR